MASGCASVTLWPFAGLVALTWRISNRRRHTIVSCPYVLLCALRCVTTSYIIYFALLVPPTLVKLVSITKHSTSRPLGSREASTRTMWFVHLSHFKLCVPVPPSYTSFKSVSFLWSVVVVAILFFLFLFGDIEVCVITTKSYISSFSPFWMHIF